MCSRREGESSLYSFDLEEEGQEERKREGLEEDSLQDAEVW